MHPVYWSDYFHYNNIHVDDLLSPPSPSSANKTVKYTNIIKYDASLQKHTLINKYDASLQKHTLINKYTNIIKYDASLQKHTLINKYDASLQKHIYKYHHISNMMLHSETSLINRYNTYTHITTHDASSLLMHIQISPKIMLHLRCIYTNHQPWCFTSDTMKLDLHVCYYLVTTQHAYPSYSRGNLL